MAGWNVLYSKNGMCYIAKKAPPSCLGFFDQNEINKIMEESVKMKQFDHPNVMNLIGVCINAGPAPYIVMPFMANGSLLSYLRKERSNLILDKTTDEDLVKSTFVCFIISHTNLPTQTFYKFWTLSWYQRTFHLRRILPSISSLYAGAYFTSVVTFCSLLHGYILYKGIRVQFIDISELADYVLPTTI